MMKGWGFRPVFLNGSAAIQFDNMHSVYIA